MNHATLEQLVKQVFGRGKSAPASLEAVMGDLPETDRAAVMAFGRRLAVAGPGAGSLPAIRIDEAWA